MYPALQDFGKELDRYGIGYKLTDQIDERGKAGIVVDHGGEMDFIYEVRCRSHVTPSTISAMVGSTGVTIVSTIGQRCI